MSSGTRTILELFLFVFGILLFTVLAYFTCTYFEGATLAKASGLSLQTWTDNFTVLVKMSCALTAICLFLWYILTKLVFQVQSNADWGKRTVWFVFFLIVTVGVLAITNVYAETLRIKTNLFVNVILCQKKSSLRCVLDLVLSITPKNLKSSPLNPIPIR